MSNRLQKLFTNMPLTHEFLNHLLTFGQDILWRWKAAKAAAIARGTAMEYASAQRRRQPTFSGWQKSAD